MKMATKKPKNQPSNGWPKMNQGTHLTVKTFEDGSTELIWDDEQLLKEVKEAIASYEQIESVTPTKKTKGKKNVSTQ
jgi:hypothetical protein